MLSGILTAVMIMGTVTEQVKWPPFTRETKQVMQIDSQPKVCTDPWKPLRETLETYGSLKVTV